jgi:hypothetical protein|tara:strand:+ start:339 stop:494 length:156 start_codon:yes stop_codon:yes gene_type:complete
MAKKTDKVEAKVEKVVEKPKEKVTLVSEKLVSRRGKTITIKTYSDGKIEEL